MTIHHVTHAAKTVERAAEALNAAADVLQATQGEVARIHVRIAPHDQARDAIIARHQQGDGRTNDAGELTLIQADKDGLTKMLPEAEAAVVAAQSAHQQATSALAEAKKVFDRAEMTVTLEATLAQVTEHVEKLEQSLNMSAELAGKLMTVGGSGAVVDIPQVMARLEASVLAGIKLGVAMSAGHPYHTRPHWKPSELLQQGMRKLEFNDGRFQ